MADTAEARTMLPKLVAQVRLLPDLEELAVESSQARTTNAKRLRNMKHSDPPSHPILKTHDIQLRVRYDEADPMGFLYHPRYFTYFEIARTEMLRASGGNYRQMEADGLFAVVVKAECKYHRPARYDDLLTIRATLHKITTAKIEHEYLVLRGNDRLATGHVTLALVDRSGQIQKVPDWLRELG